MCTPICALLYAHFSLVATMYRCFGFGRAVAAVLAVLKASLNFFFGGFVLVAFAIALPFTPFTLRLGISSQQVYHVALFVATGGAGVIDDIVAISGVTTTTAVTNRAVLHLRQIVGSPRKAIPKS